IQLWRWENRWFKPLSREEFDVSVATTGQVVGFDHETADEAAGANLSEAEARARAERFLSGVMNLDWSGWTEVGAERQAKPHRTDYIFTWKDTQPLVAGATGAIGQAEHRHVVRVQGAEVAAYATFVKVPDQWMRNFAQLRSRNNDAGLVDGGLLLIVFVALIFILIMRIRHGDIRWRNALWIGFAGAVLSLLATLNSMGQALFGYQTTQSWASFLASSIFGALASAVGVGVFLLVLTAAAESLYRERFPEKQSLASTLSWRGVRSKTFFISMVLGLMLAAFFFAYQTVFYLIANHFGAWAPADIPYDDLLNTKLPWAFVLFGGFFPAISEEFGFRMFAIPLFEKWFRYLWVAVIAASFLWGFGHATYPNEPWFIRGVEVGLGGVLLSWIMIRFGILTTVVWHYTVDALYTAMLLLRAHDGYLRWSGATTAFLALVPLLIAIVAYRRHHGFADETALTNGAEGSAAMPVVSAAVSNPATAPPAEAPPPPLPAYEPISGNNWTTGIIIAAALLSAFAVPIAQWDSALPWRASRDQAIAAARNFLASQNWAVSGYRVAAATETAAGALHGEENQIAADQIFRRGGRRSLIAAFSGPLPTVPAEYWQIRFFRDRQEREYYVVVRADSRQIVGFSRVIAESDPGASPPLSVAQARAASFLAARGINVAGMALKIGEQERQTARVDSTFVWEQALPASSPITYRVEADLQGNDVSLFRAWYHVPESMIRDYEQSTLGSLLLAICKALMFAAAAALVFYLIFRFARHSAFAWSTLIKISAVAALVTLIATANALPTTWMAYTTDTPWAAFMLSSAIGWLVAGLGAFLFTLALLAALAITAPNATALTWANARRQLERETAWDALWLSLLALAWYFGWARVQAVVASHWHNAGLAPWPTPPGALAHWLPGLSDALSAPVHGLWVAAGLGILLPVLCARKNRPWAIAGLALLWLGSLPSLHQAPQFLQAALFSAVALALLLGFGNLFLRSSPLAYFSAALVPSLTASALGWLTLPAPHAVWAGVVLLAMLLGWLLWLAAISQRRAPAVR
ncbi:MAG TPA: CPBP family intramembrane glutamic endopeptidase, partial [Terriglobales bacterium]